MIKSLDPSLPILLVDDEEELLKSFNLVLRSAGIHNVISCQDSREVMSILSKQVIELMLLDLAMPYITGEALLETVKNEFPEVPVIIITGTNDLDTAIRCMKSGAIDYIVKPVEKMRLLSGVTRAIEMRELQRENILLRRHIFSDSLEHPEAFTEIICTNKNMRSIFQYCESIAKTPQPVLITGETGVGKELIAKSIHTLSRRKGNFVAVNAAGLDDNMFSDSLFGHLKGAFTGADHARKGLIEQAENGTLFLDEIGDLSLAAQVKLLRLIQEQEYFPVGSDIVKRSNARLVVSTNQDLEVLQQAGKFRKDLYFRFCSHQIHIPPLRERMDDISFLADHFLEKAAKTLEKTMPTAPDELITLLSSYHFPGNVRELESILFDAVSNHHSGKLSLVGLKHYISKKRSSPEPELPSSPSEKDVLVSFSGRLPTLQQANELLISETLKRTNGNQSMAAQILGISRQTLIRHLKQSSDNVLKK